MTSARSAIQSEIRQGQPFRARTQEGLLALLRTVDVVKRVVARAVEAHDLTLQQYNVLRILRGAKGEDLPTLEIAERMIEQTPGITRLLDRLEAKGLVSRARCDHDRRQVLCGITPLGLKLLATLQGPMDRADEAALGMLSGRELNTLIALLDRIRAAHH